MELVAMPLSQRTRSSPVTRSQPVWLSGEIPVVWSKAAREPEVVLGAKSACADVVIASGEKTPVHLIIAVDCEGYVAASGLRRGWKMDAMGCGVRAAGGEFCCAGR